MEEKKVLNNEVLEKITGGVDLSEELKSKISEAKSEDELLKILDEDGQELSDDELEYLFGPNYFGYEDRANFVR